MPLPQYLRSALVAGANFLRVIAGRGWTTNGPSPWIDVTDAVYGADPLGVNDSTAAIQAAITAALAGGMVVVPFGTYNISTQLDFTGAHNMIFTGLSSEGDGLRKTVFNWIGAAGGTVFNVNRVHGGQFRNFAVVGAAAFGVGIDIDMQAGGGQICTNIEFKDIEIVIPPGQIGIRGSHVSSSNCERMTFRRVSSHGAGGGALLGAYSVKIEGGQCNNWSFYGCSFQFCNYGVASQTQASGWDCNFSTNSIFDILMTAAGNSVWAGCTSQSSAAWLSTAGSTATSQVVLLGWHATVDMVVGVAIAIGDHGAVTAIACDFAGNTYNSLFRVNANNSPGGGNFNAFGCNFPNGVIMSPAGNPGRYTLFGCTYNNPTAQGRGYPLPDVIGATAAGSLKNIQLGGLLSGQLATGLKLLGGGLFVNVIAPPTGITVVPTGADNGVTYSYFVVPVDVAGNRGLASATISTVHGPTTLSATNFVTVTWSASPGAVSYDIVRSVGGVAQGSIALGLDVLTIKDTGLVATVYTALTRSVSADSTVGGLLTSNSRASKVTIVSSNYQATLDDSFIVASGVGTTVTLPPAPPDGFELTVKRVDAANAQTVARGGADVIELLGITATSRSLNSNGAVLVLKYAATGTTWYSPDVQGTVA